MNFFNFLSVDIATFSGFGGNISLNFIGKMIDWLISSVGNIGLGIILFTLILKLITLPLDILSRISMKKQSLKLESMRPKLEKLQRQYANNKQLYNQKIQALYKKEGYSMLMTCLPSLVSIVIFMVVIGQFDNYAKRAEWIMYNDMASAYTQAIVDYDADSDKDIVQIVDGKAYLNVNTVFETSEEFTEARKYITKTADANVSYDASFTVDSTKLNDFAVYLKTIANSELDIKVSDDSNNINGYHIYKDGDNYVYNKEHFKKLKEDGVNYDYLTETEINTIVATDLTDYLFDKYVDNNVKEAARTAAVDNYYKNAPKFLWIKNLWMPDLPYKHPVYSSLAQSNFAKSSNITVDEVQYSEITAKLDSEKKAPNGFFVLIVFSIGFMFLSQLVMTKTQKSQMELQSVDGQAAKTSKMMMIMMPIIFGIFSFMYSGAFSLYMTVSTVISMIFTLSINFIVGKIFMKKYGE